MTTAARLMREPLLHFLLGGTILFGLYAWLDPDTEPRAEHIVVTKNQIALLTTTFERTWLRPPTGDELTGLIDDFVTEEVLYREALKLGLDRNDLVVRRRMRQKMEFLQQDLGDVPEPTQAELARFLDENPDAFREPERWSFRHLFVDRERAGARAQDRALALLDRVRSEPQAPANELGDPTLLPRELEAATRSQIGLRFGEDFARALVSLPEGTWIGPVDSEFGLHLVLVTERRPSRSPDLGEIREQVAREWTAKRRREASARFQRLLREPYEIEIQLPPREGDPSLAYGAP